MSETIELFQAVPKLTTKKERMYAQVIAAGLSYGYIILALIVWSQSNWYIALSTLFLAYIVSGIVSSKLLHRYVPHKQHEFSYTSKDIAAWMIDYYHDKEETE